MTTPYLTLDVIIPCYQAQDTIARAVESALAQDHVRSVIVVNDASTDASASIIDDFVRRYPARVRGLHLPDNGGVARARNWGALNSDADVLAFLDADDAYEGGALAPITSVFAALPELSLVRLKLTAVDMPSEYAQHPAFEQAWDIVQMTVGGNMVFRRSVLLACGGFPQDELFRRLGGEDGALGIALGQRTAVGTLFSKDDAGVLHYCRHGMHAERLLRSALYGEAGDVTSKDLDTANAVTQRIIERLDHAHTCLNSVEPGRRPITITYRTQ